MRNIVDQIYLYEDKKCIEAALFMLENTHTLMELSASICIVPFLTQDIKFKPDDVIVIIVCGGNSDLEKLKPS